MLIKMLFYPPIAQLSTILTKKSIWANYKLFYRYPMTAFRECIEAQYFRVKTRLKDNNFIKNRETA